MLSYKIVDFLLKPNRELLTRTPILVLTAGSLCIGIILTGVMLTHLRQLPDPNSETLLTDDQVQVIKSTTEQLVLIGSVMSLLLAICTGMMLVSIRPFTREQRSIEHHLKQMNDYLEQRIAERTAELQLTEESLEKERYLLRAVTDALPDFIWIKDEQCRVTFANAASVRFRQLPSADSMIGKTDLDFDFHPPELAAKYFADEQAFLQSDQDIIQHEDQLTDAEGNRMWVMTTRAVLRDESGKKVGFVGISRDITAQRQTQESLAAERTLLRTLIDVLPDHIYVKDRESRFIIGNAAVAATIDISPDELLGKSDLDLSPYEIAQKFYADEQRVMETGEALINHEELNINNAGVERWFTTTKIPLRDAQGKITGLVGVSHDITEQRRSEEALHRLTEDLWQERAQLRAILDSMTEGVIFDQGLQVRYINKALSEMMGYSFDDWWDSYMDLLKPIAMNDEEFDRWRTQIFEVVRDMGIWQGEMQLRRKDGDELAVEMTITQVTDSDGRIIGAVTIIRDISNQKVLAAQKARFVANASHELRTPITNLKTRLYLFRMQPENSNSHLVVMERVVERMRRLVEDLLDVSRFEHGQIELNLEPVLLRRLVEEVVDTQRPEADAKSIKLSAELSEETLEVQADPERVIQVMTNLVTNAINYTPEGGRILVEMLPDESSDGTKLAVIRVRDNGPGIEQELLEHIFQPFFRASNGRTTGSGLGLTICKEIVEAHGGEISVESEVGHGSCFIVKLPRKPNT